MATPAIDHDVRIAPGSADQIDAVMRVMDAAFGDRFGEAWTRSQLSGILPMAGVAMTLALDRARDTVVGFSLMTPATLRFRRRRPSGFDRASLDVAPRSAYLLAGESRWDWEHSIVPGDRLRFSITLRTLSAKGRKIAAAE